MLFKFTPLSIASFSNPLPHNNPHGEKRLQIFSHRFFIA